MVFLLSVLFVVIIFQSSLCHEVTARDLHLALSATDRIAGLVVKASASRKEDPGFKSRFRRDFSGSSHTSDLHIGTPDFLFPSGV